MFEYFTGPVGVSPEKAERILADDLLLTDPGSRYGYEPQKAIELWSEVQEKLFHLSEAAMGGDVFGSGGVWMLLQDAWLRAASYAGMPRSAQGESNKPMFTGPRL